MVKPLWYRWARVYATGGAIIGTGVLLYTYTVPTDEQLVAAFSPEIRANYERNRALRQREQEELMKIVQETAQSNEPIWKTGRITSPFEKETRGQDPRLVDQKVFFHEQELAKKREEVAAADAELAETEALIAKPKGWWRWK